MDKVNIKIGNVTYSDVSVINVDKADGGSANFIYNGIVAPATIINYFELLELYSNAHPITPNITNNIMLN